MKILICALWISTQTGCLAVGATLAVQALDGMAETAAAERQCIEGHPAAQGLHYDKADPCMPAKVAALSCADVAGGATQFDRDAWDFCMQGRGWDVSPRLWALQPYGELRELPKRGQSATQRAMGPGQRRR